MSAVPCDARGCRAIATQQRITTISTGGYDGPITREVTTDLCDLHAQEHDGQDMAKALVEGRVPEPPSAAWSHGALDLGIAPMPPLNPSVITEGWAESLLALIRPLIERARAEQTHTRREGLADLAHQQWSGWMAYLFEKSTANEDGTVTIPAWAVERWKRQIATPYADLEASEQESDRAEADRVLALIGGE